MKVIEEFEYKGYMCSDAQKFFKDKIITEVRDGCAVVGNFIRLSDGSTHLPSKKDKFKKYEDGSIKLKEISEKEELLQRLHSLNDQAFLKYLIKTGWCMREAWDLFIEEWSVEDIVQELNFLRKENIGKE